VISNRSARPLNIRAFKKGDVVIHYRKGTIARISGLRWRSETYDMVNLSTGEPFICHPKWWDLCTDPLLVLAAAAVE